MSLNNLASGLEGRFKQWGALRLSDLGEAIELYRAALAFRPPGSFNRSTYLNDLAISLRDRFHQQHQTWTRHSAFFHNSLKYLVPSLVANFALPSHGRPPLSS